MEIKQDFDLDLGVAGLELPRRWDARLARWISNLLSPAVIAPLGILLAIQAAHSAGAWLWAGYYLVIAVLAPLVYVVYLAQRGIISDIYMPIRRERIRPMLFMLVCALAGWLSLWAGRAPLTLVIFAGIGALQLGFMLLVTLRWKISAHASAIAGLSVFLVGLYGAPAVPLFLAVPLVAWSRVRLRRHTMAQTLGGALAGAAFTMAMVFLLARQCAGETLICTQ